MPNEIKDHSPACPTCGRYLTVLGCTADKCAGPAEDRVLVLGSSVWESRGRWWDELIDKLEDVRRCDGRLPNEHLCQLVRGHDGPHLHDCVRGRCDADGQERA